MTVQDLINELQRMIIDGRVSGEAEVWMSKDDVDLPLCSDDLMYAAEVSDPEGEAPSSDAGFLLIATGS